MTCSDTEERYDNLGGIYFPILQHDGSRVLVKVRSGHHRADVSFLAYLRKHDRKVAARGEDTE